MGPLSVARLRLLARLPIGWRVRTRCSSWRG